MTLLEVSNLNFYLCKERTVLLQRAVIRTKYVVYAICLGQCLERCKILAFVKYCGVLRRAGMHGRRTVQHRS